MTILQATKSKASSALSRAMIDLQKHSDAAALLGRLFFSSMFLLFGYGRFPRPSY